MTTLEESKMRTVTTWGKKGGATAVPKSFRVRTSEIRSPLDGALARIRRETGLVACGVTPQGTSLDRAGNPESRHYSVTLGCPLRTGGYSVEGSLWLAIDLD